MALILACLSMRGQDSNWDALIKAGKTAMEKRQYAEAERDFRDALAAAEKYGEKDARFAGALLFLAQACDAQSKRDEAEVFAKRASDAMEKAVKNVKLKKAEEQFLQADVACATFDKAADIFAAHQKYADAESLYSRVIKIRADMAVEKQTPQNNEDYFRWLIQITKGAKTKLALANETLGNLYFIEHKYPEAAAVYAEAVRIRQSDQGTDQPGLAQALTNLATSYAAQGKYDQAEPPYQRALAVFERARWEKPETITTLQMYALMLKKAGRDEEAKAMVEKAAAIKNKLSQKAP
jgi:tetratricopeptide (TPR) repeat protein